MIRSIPKLATTNRKNLELRLKFVRFHSKLDTHGPYKYINVRSINHLDGLLFLNSRDAIVGRNMKKALEQFPTIHTHTDPH